MTIKWSFSYNSFVKFHGKKNWDITLLYPNPCYNEVCYKGTALQLPHVKKNCNIWPASMLFPLRKYLQLNIYENVKSSNIGLVKHSILVILKFYVSLTCLIQALTSDFQNRDFLRDSQKYMHK